jgi:hypothetical protein
MAILAKKDTSELVSKIFEPIEIPGQYRERFVNRVANLFDNSSIIFNKDIFEVWARAVYDPNPLHQDEEYAKSVKGMNYTTTPVFGSLISSNGELIINKIVDELNLIRSKKIFFSGDHVKYNGPLYPGEELNWNIGKVIPIKDTEKVVLGFNLILEGKKDGKKIITNNARFRLNRNSFGEEEELEKLLSGEDSAIIANSTFNLNYGNLEDKNSRGGLAEYKFCSGYENIKVPLMFSGALVPAGLLKLSYENTGKYNGSYGTMDFEFYSRPKLGNFKVIIKNIIEPRVRRGIHTYDFKGTVLQEGRPILSGKFKCFSDEKLSN